MPDETIDRLEVLAASSGKSLEDYVRDLFIRSAKTLMIEDLTEG